MADTKRECMRAKGRGVSIITSTYVVSLSPPLYMFDIPFALLDLYIKIIIREKILVITLHFIQKLYFTAAFSLVLAKRD